MAKVEASVEIDATLAEVWDLYFDPARWASWVDGFGSVMSSDDYPDRGGALVWRSTSAGRGQVTERVAEHQPRSLHRIEFEDPDSAGELETTFEMLPSESGRRIKVRQAMTYRLTTGGPLRPVTDVLFIRPQMRRSLERSLIELRLEAERTGGTQPG
jgi:uncharacterized protein YndB with AHSA1/START domain